MRHILIATAIIALVGCSRAEPAPPRAQVMTPSAAATTADAEDPTVTDADTYHVVLENDRVRVVDYQDVPGHRTHLHHHPDTLLVVIAPFARRITFPDGTSKERSFAPGDVVWVPAQTHVGENTGKTPSHAILIEPKR